MTNKMAEVRDSEIATSSRSCIMFQPAEASWRNMRPGTSSGSCFRQLKLPGEICDWAPAVVDVLLRLQHLRHLR